MSTFKKLGFKSVAKCIQLFGQQNSIMVKGAPGIGKSSVLKHMKEQDHNKRFNYAYMDCATMDLGDTAMPIIDKEQRVTRYATNERFMIHLTDKPVVIMLDELTKASTPVLNMLLPLVAERRIGDRMLHPESIVFMTGNRDNDGVGDKMHAHGYNRLTEIHMRGPTHKEWVEWAAKELTIAPEVLAFAHTYPALFEDYETATNNKMIFNPKTGQVKQFVSPRSLANTSSYVYAYTKNQISIEECQALTEGTIGESAAADLNTILTLGQMLPSFEEIKMDKNKALQKIQGAGLAASAVMATQLVAVVKNEDDLKIATEFVSSLSMMEAKFLFQNMILPRHFSMTQRVPVSKALTNELASYTND